MGSCYTDSVSAWRERADKDLRTVGEFVQEARQAAGVRGRGLGRLAVEVRRDVIAEAQAFAGDIVELADAALRSRADDRRARLGSSAGRRARPGR